jgi:uncharacterized ion transporter superfamily protein YfcC
MATVATFAGVDRSLVVTADQSASGGLAIARGPSGKYLRLVRPLLLVLAVLTIVMLATGSALT